MTCVGDSGDIGRFRDVVQLLRQEGLNARRVRVGSIDVELAPAPLALPSGVSPEEPRLSPADEEREQRELYESIQYGASEGIDIS